MRGGDLPYRQSHTGEVQGSTERKAPGLGFRVIVTRPLPGGPEVQLHTRERWELSRDSKALTIHVDVENPQLPAYFVGSWAEIYTRD